MTAGLYIHIPFCNKRCGYCDFYTVADRAASIPTYLDALRREMEFYAAHPVVTGLSFETLYFGGGTPSLLNAEQLSSLINSAFTKFNFVANPEVTVETNPGTVDLEKLRSYRAGGVNRLSIGVQSFDATELRFLDRNHSADEAVACFDDARWAGFDNISIDLIFALPKQSLAAWKKNLQQAAALAPEHISAYNLTYEDGTPLTRQLNQGKIKSCSEEMQRSMQLMAMEYLPQTGLAHYEISNYARSGKESRHNQKYWDGSPYLGLGASAHSFVAGKRFWNIRNYKQYCERLAENKSPVADGEMVDVDKKCFEKLFLGLRQRRGVNLRSFESEIGMSVFEKYGAILTNFFSKNMNNQTLATELTRGTQNLKSKLLKIENGFLRLTDRGVLLCDTICAEFV